MIQHTFSDLSDLFTEEYHPARSENKRFYLSFICSCLLLQLACRKGSAKPESNQCSGLDFVISVAPVLSHHSYHSCEDTNFV